LSIERIWTELDKGLRESSPLKFMRTLQATGALQCCDVLRRVFGSTLTTKQEALCNMLPAVANDDRLLIGVATMAVKAGAQLDGAPRRLSDLYKNLQLLPAVTCSAESLARVLKQAGAMREGTTFSDFHTAVLLIEFAGIKPLVFGASELKLGAELMREVKAEQFSDLEGRELGAAIDAGRVRILQTLIPDQDYIEP
jgi:hypothetical protein